MSPAQWLATKELVKDDGEMVFEDGISRFCPKHSKILKSAVEDAYPRWFLDASVLSGFRTRMAGTAWSVWSSSFWRAEKRQGLGSRRSSATRPSPCRPE